MSVVKFKNYSYLRGPKGDKGDKGDPGSGIAATTGRITYNTATRVIGFNEVGLASTTYVDNKISTLIGNAPELLNTLEELSAAIGDNASFVDSVVYKAGSTMTGFLTLSANPTSPLHAATKQYVDDAISTVPDTTDGIAEGTVNLYFTEQRARDSISVTGAGNYDSSTGVINIVGGVTSVNGESGTVVLDTGNITEGTNLYYTDSRARSAISVTGAGSYNSATGVITVVGGVTSVNSQTGTITLDTDDIAEGTNLYYTTARANTDFDTRLAAKSTTNLAEGTNLYYTDSRARSAISVSGSLSYDSATGVISYTPGINSWDGTVFDGGDFDGGPVLPSEVAIDGGFLETYYNPAVPSDWSGAPPTTVVEALDRLAAIVKALNGGVGA